MGWLFAGAVCAVCNVIVGWIAGYRSPIAYAAFWAATLLTWAAAFNLVVCCFSPTGFIDRVIRVALVAVAIVVACVLALGAVGRLTLVNVLIAHVVVFAASWLLVRRPEEPTPPDVASIPAGALAIAGALLAFALAFAVAHAPLTLYDSVSYHLFFSARWVQDHVIAIIPTPFSDEAQAYAPGNGEAFFAWLMLPFHGDLLARMGQLPFALLAAAALYGLARRLGARPAHAVYPAAFLLLSRPIVEQTMGADVDLVCAAFFLTSLYLGIAAVDRDRARDWAIFGVSLGLYWGSKYVALVYTPVFLLLAFARGPRRRAIRALPGIAAFALPWYLRNWVVAGSPIYPSSLAIGGVTVAQGAFDRVAMLNTIFHTTDLRLFPAIAAHGFGPALILIWVPLAVAGWIVMARRGWWPHGFLVAVPLLMAPLYWYGFPVNVDSRFLMPALGPALLPIAFLFPAGRRAALAVHMLLTAALLWLVIGAPTEIPARVPWFMNGWLTLDGLVPLPFVAWFAVAAAGLAAAWHFGRRSARLAATVTLALLACVSSALVLGAAALCGAPACDYLDATSPFFRQEYVDAWRWTAANVRNSTVAYTGINLPYPLTGEQLTNRVVYANIDGHPRWRFHDYARAYQVGSFVPQPPLLATSSGELLPAASPAEASRPRYERMEGAREAWLWNLDALGVRHVFVAALSAYELNYNWHDEREFPIEEAWAAADPAHFQPVYSNARVRIYAFAGGGKTHP